jgi:hypothetical protein
MQRHAPIVQRKTAAASLQSSSSSLLKLIGVGGWLGFRHGKRQELLTCLAFPNPSSETEVLATYVELAGVVRLLVALGFVLGAKQHTLIRIVVLHGFIWLWSNKD